MPGLMALRSYKDEQPLAGSRIGCLHMTIQTAVLIETLIALGAEVTWSLVTFSLLKIKLLLLPLNSSLRLERFNEVDFDWCIEQTLFFGEDRKPLNMILDDGGDLTNMVIDRYPELVAGIKGLSEETTTEFTDYTRKSWNITNACNVNDSVTKSKFDNKYGCKESAVDAVRRATDYACW
jgi:adenosylhomocysteinase